MDKEPVTITLDGQTWDENSPLTFSDILHNENESVEQSDGNSVTVSLNESVELRAISLSPVDNSSLPEDVRIVIRKYDPDTGDVESFEDDNGNTIPEDLIHHTNNQFTLPAELPEMTDFILIVISPSETLIHVTIGFRGCIHQGMKVQFSSCKCHTKIDKKYPI